MNDNLINYLAESDTISFMITSKGRKGVFFTKILVNVLINN